MNELPKRYIDAVRFLANTELSMLGIIISKSYVELELITNTSKLKKALITSAITLSDADDFNLLQF